MYHLPLLLLTLRAFIDYFLLEVGIVLLIEDAPDLSNILVVFF